MKKNLSQPPGQSFLAVLLVLALVVVLGGAFCRYLAKLQRSTAIGTKPPSYDWQVTDMSGRVFPLQNAQGKVVFLNFWATWCAPCRQEMPSIEHLYAQFKDNPGIIFLCVSDEEPAVLQRFLAEHPLQVPVYRLEGRRPEAFQARGIPVTFVLSRDGKMAVAHEGARPWDSPDTLKTLQKLLNS